MSSGGIEQCSVLYAVYIKTAESVEAVFRPKLESQTFFVLGIGGWVRGDDTIFRLRFTCDTSGRSLKVNIRGDLFLVYSFSWPQNQSSKEMIYKIIRRLFPSAS